MSEPNDASATRPAAPAPQKAAPQEPPLPNLTLPAPGVSPRTGMVLAAGLGTRMRPLTETTPKPLLRLQGESLLDHILDQLDAAGIGRVVVNAHHLAPQVEAACATRNRPACEVIVEPELLETGGGIRNALPKLGPDPFVAVNGDSYWLNGPVPALRRLFAAFDPEAMDVLLLVARAATVEGDVGRGDFALDPLGRIRRPKEREVVPYTYAGVQVLHPRLFDGAPEGAWSMNRLYDKAIAAGRAFALVHDGVWFHLSTPEDLEQAEHRLQRGLVRFF
ncbi:Mannose-1-phosphate guanyltransferase [Roseomonas mucosa]|uniref:Bifunctional N-acetylglucosamine-1-phosphate uridyltransferase/glucosamine-1-phosphate acetyltransferase n=3 Tax=Pseudomonadota TaxID=1224 RepID=A0A1S8D6V8_9PROT|nr:nucleotidyltransferase family protein [Roseomonas sp. FDAARGOS_362]AWV24507.1 Mannose-1-phosphate guanyltransferase [Roseomonas mucosa]GAV33704.1 D-glycero-alpha-D-manno-heptose 1-phosphate guanylyltransferase [Roseomonas sp. TAS13]ONH84102.1 mannose-1-phosphate guanylyltransferase [Roseomonas mucosa]QDD96713.1 Mannose-1-phosphate guanyltransferase [Roseomonas mucosa]